MKNVSFLVVDDSQSVRSIVKSTIYDQLGSQRILSAVNGLTAKLILQKQPIDIIISDMEMPNMDGFELLSFVRSDPKLKFTPFIMMTPEDSKDFVVKAIEKGVNQYLVKPFTTEKLEEAIRSSWYGAEQRRNARITSLPPHSLKATFNEEVVFEGHIKNISASGILFEVEHHSSISLFEQCGLELSFRFNNDRTIHVPELLGHIIRLEAVRHSDSEDRYCNVAVSLDDANTDIVSINALKKVMDVLTLPTSE